MTTTILRRFPFPFRLCFASSSASLTVHTIRVLRILLAASFAGFVTAPACAEIEVTSRECLKSARFLAPIDSPVTVISNGRLLSRDKDPATGLMAFHWSQEKPHANYLITLVAGFFKKLEDKYAPSAAPST